MSLDEAQGGLRVERARRGEDHGCPENEKREEAIDPADVEQRLTRQPHVVLARSHLVDPAQRARHEVAVRQDRSLRPAGRSRRVTHERRIVLEHVRRLAHGRR